MVSGTAIGAGIAAVIVIGLIGWGFYQDYNPFVTAKPVQTLEMEKVAELVADGVNSQRTEAGIAAVPWSQKLADLGAAHAQDMIARGYYDHTTPDGKDLIQRTREAGLYCSNPPYNLMAENLAISGPRFGYSTNEEVADHVIKLWMESSGHRQNILTPTHDNIGVGAALDGSGQVYVALELC